jgi:hypothetical protein
MVARRQEEQLLSQKMRVISLWHFMAEQVQKPVNVTPWLNSISRV